MAATGSPSVWRCSEDERTLAPWKRRAASAIAAPLLALELWVHPRDSAVGLNGSGLLIANPPWQYDEAAAAWQAVLARQLDPGSHGGHALQWIVHGT